MAVVRFFQLWFHPAAIWTAVLATVFVVEFCLMHLLPWILPERSSRVLFEHVQPVDEQAVVDRVLSVSFMASLPREEQDVVEQEVRELAHDATELSYMTELYLGFKPS